MNMTDVKNFYNELQGLDTQNPGAWSKDIHIFFSVVLFIAILIGGIYFLVKPQYNSLGNAQKKEISLKDEFETKQKEVSALDAYKKQLEQMNHDFGDMLKQLPSKSEVANLLNDISQSRVANGLDEELFQPQPEIAKDFYYEIPNKVTVTGTYHQMGSFVSGVAALPRIVTIDDVEIKPIGGNTPKDMLRMNATIKTYRYLDPSEVPKKVTTTGKTKPKTTSPSAGAK